MSPSSSKRDAQKDAPRNIIFIDPRQFSQFNQLTQLTDNIISSDTKSKLVRFAVVCKKFSEKWFSHVLLLAFLILYACIGAWVFVAVEGPYEASQKTPILQKKEETIQLLWQERSFYYPSFQNTWTRKARLILEKFELKINESCKTMEFTGLSDTTMWEFWTALFFSMTIFTTIGYGENPPKTTAGKAITMLYAFIGIPLLLMVLADLGKIFTRGIKFIFKFFRNLYYTRSFRQVRKVGRRATLIPTQYMGAALDAMNRGLPFIPNAPKAKRGSKDDLDDKNNEKRDSRIQTNPGYKPPLFLYSTSPSYQKSQLNRSQNPIILRTDPTPPQSAIEMTSAPDSPAPIEIEVDDEFNLPITLALSILFIYLCLGAILFWRSEGGKWTLFESFYFVFISMSTIGFGDFVPNNKIIMMCAFIYLLFGLALTSMCINVVQEKLSSTFQKAKMTIGESIGLDVEQMMQDELEAEQKEKDRSRDVSAEKSASSKEGSVDRLDDKRDKQRSSRSSRSPAPETKSNTSNTLNT